MTFQYTNTLAVRTKDGEGLTGEVVKLKRGIFDVKTLGSTNMKPEQMNPSKKGFFFQKPCTNISFHVNFPVCISWNLKKHTNLLNKDIRHLPYLCYLRCSMLVLHVFPKTQRLGRVFWDSYSYLQYRAKPVHMPLPQTLN